MGISVKTHNVHTFGAEDVRRFHPRVWSGMAQLFTAAGKPDIICTVAYAVEFCIEHPDWRWEEL
jgi:hypothetical protein